MPPAPGKCSGREQNFFPGPGCESPGAGTSVGFHIWALILYLKDTPKSHHRLNQRCYSACPQKTQQRPAGSGTLLFGAPEELRGTKGPKPPIKVKFKTIRRRPG